MKSLIKKLFLATIVLPIQCFGGEVHFSDPSEIVKVGKGISVFEDKSGSMSAESVLGLNNFQSYQDDIINYGITNSVIWIKLTVTNHKSTSPLYLEIPHALIDEITFYPLQDNKCIDSIKTGIEVPYYQRKYDHPNYIFDLNINKNETKDYLIRIESDLNIIVPMEIGTYKTIFGKNQQIDFIYGGYVGIFLIMMLYNLFLYFSTKDKSNLFYILYIPFVCILQLENQGYIYKFLSDVSFIDPKYILYLVTPVQVVFGVLFLKETVPVKETHPKLTKGLELINYSFIATLALTFLGYYKTSFIVLNALAFIIGVYIIALLVILSRRGSRTASLLLAAFSLYFIGLLLFVSKNLGLLPYNTITNFTATIGSVIDIFVLSLALGDKINILKNENEKKQQEIIKHLKENESFLKQTQEFALKTEMLEREKLLFEFEALKNQVNPHFLFNSLNVLTELVEENKEEAVHFIKELSEVYRYVLNSKNQNVVTLEEELSFIRSFLYLLNIRFSDNLKTIINIDVQNKTYIPPLSIQVLIENAIKHNIISESHPLTININSENDYIVIKNNIKKKQGLRKSTGLGLKNINSRIEFLSNKSIVVEEKSETFTVKVPLIFKSF